MVVGYAVMRGRKRTEHDTLAGLALVGIDRQLWFMGV